MNKQRIQDWFSGQDCSDRDAEAINRWQNALAEVGADFVEHTPMSGDVIVALRSLNTAAMEMRAALTAAMPKLGGK